MSTHTLEIDDTELVMIHEALLRVRPFAEMSAEMAQAGARLEARIRARVDALSGGTDQSRGFDDDDTSYGHS